MIRTLLVDDEDLARRGLSARLERAQDIQIVAECCNGHDAIVAINQLSPDLIFLDVQMPEVSGFDVVRAIGSETTPYIIFVTAFDQYAVHAFEVHALDYLLKPVDDRRLEEALQNARSTLKSERERMLGRSVAAAIANLSPPGAVTSARWSADRLMIPSGDRMVVVRVAEIDWVEAAGNYVSLHVDKKTWLLRETIASMDRRLALHGFARVHRSTIVNVERVTELRPLGNGDFSIVLRDGTSLKMTRYYRPSLGKLLGDTPDPER